MDNSTRLPRRDAAGLLGAAVLCGLRGRTAMASAQPVMIIGDGLVEVSNPDGPSVTAAQIDAADAPVLCWPVDPVAGSARRGISYNRLWVLKTTSGFRGFSVICQHAGCLVSVWDKPQRRLVCPCHGSAYDVDHGGGVVDGPAPTPLPYVKLDDRNGLLRVASALSGPIGSHASRAD